MQVLQLLDLTMDDFNADLKAYQGIGEMIAEADKYENLRNIARECGERVQANKKEAADTVRRLEVERRQLTIEHLTANHRAMRGKAAVEQLQRTRDRHPRVFDPPAKLVGKDTARALSRKQTAAQRVKREAAKSEQQTRREAKEAASRDAAVVAAQQHVMAEPE